MNIGFGRRGQNRATGNLASFEFPIAIPESII